MADILLGESYYLRFDPKLWRDMRPYPPLGTLYAASVLRQRGHDVALFDAMLAESTDDWSATLDRERPRYAVLFEDNFNYLSKMCLLRMREAAFAMSRAAKARGCTVIACGSDATDHAGRYFEAGADYVLVGEGEATLCELMDRLTGRSTTPLESILGLAWRDPAGVERRTAARPDIRDLDSLPFPARDLVDVARYRRIWRARHGRFSLNVATTRGCPFHCNWCAKPIWGQRYNVRSPENVVAELSWLKQVHRPDHISYVDDIMGLKPGWLEAFADLVEREDLRIPFKSLNRADLLLRGDAVRALARAGAESVWIGAESGSQRILDAMEKGTTVGQVREDTQRLRAHGIGVGFFLQFGYPGETRDDIEQTFDLVRDCRPDEIGISVSYPLPGTRFYEAVRDQLGEQRNWVDSEDLAMLYRGPYTTAFYRKLAIVLHHEFRALKAGEELGGVARAPRRLRPRHVRRAAGLLVRRALLPLERLRLERLARNSHPGPAPGSPAQRPAPLPRP